MINLSIVWYKKNLVINVFRYSLVETDQMILQESPKNGRNDFAGINWIAIVNCEVIFLILVENYSKKKLHVYDRQSIQQVEIFDFFLNFRNFLNSKWIFWLNAANAAKWLSLSPNESPKNWRNDAPGLEWTKMVFPEVFFEI